MRGFAGVAFRSIGSGLSRRCQTTYSVRPLSTAAPSGTGVDNGTHNSSESFDESVQRMFDDTSSGTYFDKLDKILKSRQTPGSHTMDGLDESLSTLTDGMDEKLMKKATYFDFDPDEVDEDGYSFRPDMSFHGRLTYDTKDLDLTKPGVRKPVKRYEFEVTTETVLRQADFRNVRFLANFITEAGILVKRSKTGISAKAQRKVAREIKTARAFGLMPFTTMGTKSFSFGRTMETLDADFEYKSLKDDMLDEEDEQ